MNIIPWYKMPVELMALPFNERESALGEWESRHGHYDWEKYWEEQNKETK